MQDDEIVKRTDPADATAVCAFQKALLARCADCRHAVRIAIAEREMARCRQPAASTRCLQLRERLREASLFALRRRVDAPWPHTAELQLQCGGLRGLQAIQDAGTGAAPDVDSLVTGAEARYASLDALPFAEIVRAVGAFRPRRRVE